MPVASSRHSRADRTLTTRTAAGIAGRLPAAAQRRATAILRVAPAGVLALFAAGILLRLALTISYRPAFLGFPDAQGYVEAASDGIFDNSLRTGGYALFLRAVHALSDDLAVTILLQHLLGVASAALLYAAVRRVGASPWLAALPAAVVLFGGVQLYLEHSPLSEALFGCLICAALFCAAQTIAGGRAIPWLLAVGGLLGAAAVIRPAGLLVAPVLALWVLFDRAPRRVLTAGALVVVAALPMVAYVVAQSEKTGFTGITRSEGWSLYGRVAEFADCSRFDPPAGTAVLCEETPAVERRAAADYLFDPAVSPAIQAYGRLPSENDEVGAFARAAILGDPLAYLRTVARDFVRYATPNSWERQGMGFQTETLVPYIHDQAREDQAIRAVARYWDTAGFARSDLRGFDAYANAVTVEGPLVALLGLLALCGLVALRGLQRRAAALFALTALALMLFPVATLSYDVRYATPAYGPLAAAAALGLGALIARIRADSERAATP